MATRSDVGNDEESLISDFFCPSGELGEREREFSPLYKGGYSGLTDCGLWAYSFAHGY